MIMFRRRDSDSFSPSLGGHSAPVLPNYIPGIYVVAEVVAGLHFEHQFRLENTWNSGILRLYIFLYNLCPTLR